MLGCGWGYIVIMYINVPTSMHENDTPLVCDACSCRRATAAVAVAAVVAVAVVLIVVVVVVTVGFT